MPIPVTIIGLGAGGLAGLSPGSRESIAEADFLAGGTRHLGLVGRTGAETMAIANNLENLAARLGGRREDERCVVLASGDPLFFGIGRFLIERLGREGVRVEPAVSSMQIAFARAGESWQDAAIASVHGRNLVATLLPLLGKPKVGLFTRDGRSPSEVAGFFVESGLPSYRMWICEDLGSAAERVTCLPLLDVEGRTFSDLNVAILKADDPAGTTRADPSQDHLVGIPDDLFDRPDDGALLLTHADVRVVTLSRFRGLPPGPIWDIGAGLGGVAVELARAFPGRRVLAIERSEKLRPHLLRNRARFGAYNLLVVAGEAPGCLLPEDERPAAVFLGGTGGRLDAVLDLVFDRLEPGGVLAANFVGLENLARLLERLRAEAWEPDVSQVQVSAARPLRGLTTFVPLRPVWIVRAVKPGAGP